MGNGEIVKEIKRNSTQCLSIVQTEGEIYFQREMFSSDNYALYAQLQKQTNSGLPEIFQLGIIEGHLVIREEFIYGKTLNELIVLRKLSKKQIYDYFLQLLQIVNFLHHLKKPIIHRDIKPENIMVTDNGKVKLIDFSIARFPTSQLRDTKILGSVGYASPEQFGFQQTDARSDIYSLGVVLNQMLTGKFPNEELPKGAIFKVILKATAISPDQRYPDIKQFESAFKHAYGHKVDLTLPGFRTHTRWKMILASFAYLFAIMMFFNGNSVPPANNVYIYRAITGSYILFTILYFSNYLNIFKILPWHNSKDQAKIYFGRAIIYFIIAYAYLYFSDRF